MTAVSTTIQRRLMWLQMLFVGKQWSTGSFTHNLKAMEHWQLVKEFEKLNLNLVTSPI